MFAEAYSFLKVEQNNEIYLFIKSKKLGLESRMIKNNPKIHG